MAERVLRSPGVSTRELDLSAPGRIQPQGIPAGVIGTADKGPAFVPIVFATANDFLNMFGETKGIHFGSMAVNEWMRNARSGLFCRVLGVGNGLKKNANSVTTNAGFRVGTKMRDKDNTAASQALSSGAYAAQETDGAAHGPVPNPYAGAAIPGGLDLKTATSGTRGVTGAVAITALDFVFSTPANADGQYFFVNAPGSENATETKYAIFLSGQGDTTSGGNRSISGTAIKDGTVTIKDFSTDGVSAGNIYLVDLTDKNNNGTQDDPVSSHAELVTTIVSYINSGNLASATSAIAADGNLNSRLVITNQHKGDVSAATKGYIGTEESSLITVVTAQGGGASVPSNGEDVVAPVRFAQNIEFDYVPQDDATITITDNGGRAHIIGFKASGSVTGAQKTINTTTYSTAALVARAVANWIGAGDDTATGNHAAQAINTAVETSGNADLTNIQVTYNASSDDNLVTIQEDHSVRSGYATNALTSIAVSESAPSAPMGRTYFLGVDMFTKRIVDSTGPSQDYLGLDDDTNGATTNAKILRGVLMFPSGVIPGLQTSGGSYDAIGSSDMPSAAFGTYATGKDQGAETGALASGVFKMVLNGFTNTTSYNAHLTGSFDPLSPIYFPKVLNTDPTMIQERGHYLYAHYDVPSGLATHRTTTGNFTYLLPGAHNHNSSDFLDSGHYKPTYEIWNQKFTHASTPWILSQKLGNAAKKLFRFHMLDAGIAGHDKVKISIANIQKSTDSASDYGRFDVQIRSASDLDTAPVILQTFAGVNLNPASDRYIARVVGDQNTFFEFEKNEGKQKLVTEGLYPNRSQYVRVQVVDQVESGMMEATALPVGFQGKFHLVIDGSALSGGVDLKEPPLPLRQTVSIGAGNTKVVDPRFYWGAQYQDVREVSRRNKSTGIVSLVSNLTKHFPTCGSFPVWVGDNKGATASAGSESLDADAYNSNAFSLENIWVRCLASNTSNAVDSTMWDEAVYIRKGAAGRPLGKREDGSTFYQSVEDGVDSDKDKDADNGYRYLNVAKDFASSGSKRYYKFTVPMQGGFDGLDIFDQDKSEMTNLSSFREMATNTSSTLGGPAGSTTAAYRKALDILAEKSDVDLQILATPGMRDPGITDYAIDKTEDRFDALYVMDMPAYDHDIKLVTTSTQETSVTQTAQQLANRNIDTSFAATYFPDLVIQDGATNVVAPPSVAVLGALSLNDSVAHPWYAPAGFARGALASTIETAVKLNRPNMDVLYDTDINPITSFPQSGESVVVFGQKTMLQAQSALDRVNVRRLLIDVRRKVRTVANQILFEPNREATLARFSALVNPILGRIQAQQGVDRYKVIIDTTTTTQQDVENNTVRGKIFLQPTRSIEFISLDFVVTNAGAEI